MGLNTGSSVFSGLFWLNGGYTIQPFNEGVKIINAGDRPGLDIPIKPAGGMN